MRCLAVCLLFGQHAKSVGEAANFHDGPPTNKKSTPNGRAFFLAGWPFNYEQAAIALMSVNGVHAT